jgi:hypothetical protein
MGAVLGALVGIGMVVFVVTAAALLGAGDPEARDELDLGDIGLPATTVIVGAVCGWLFGPWARAPGRSALGLVLAMAVAAVLLGDAVISVGMAAESAVHSLGQPPTLIELDGSGEVSRPLGPDIGEAIGRLVVGSALLWLFGLLIFGWWLAFPLTLLASVAWLGLMHRLGSSRRPSDTAPQSVRPTSTATGGSEVPPIIGRDRAAVDAVNQGQRG